MQLDAEQDENAFYKPPVEPAARKLASETAADPRSGAVVTAQELDDDE